MREDLLQAAAELFAERGYSGVAIRDVTRTARVQIATLYHHYPSKADLLRAVLDWVMSPIQAERAAAMSVVAEHGRTPEIREVLRAFLGPALRHAMLPDNGRLIRRLASTLANDPSPEVRGAIASLYDAMVRDFFALLAATSPKLQGPAYDWSMACIFAIGMYLQGDLGRIAGLLNRPLEEPPERVIELVSAFIEGGLKAMPDAMR